MREIRFRAWDKKYKKMHGMEGIRDLFSIRSDGQSSSPNYLLMQFTGLFDKKGKEVWEGDIVSVDRKDSCPSFNKAIIVYAENHASFLLEYTKKVNPKGLLAQESIHSKDKKTIFGTCTGWDIEVIGNIYENWELMETNP